MSGLFNEWGPVYRRLGYEPRPIALGTKACKLKSWQEPVGEEAFSMMVAQNGHCGIGILTGTQLADGSWLAVLDVDHNAYRRLGWALMREPVSARVGKKGIAIFCRTKTLLRSETFKLPERFREEYGNPAEILAAKKLVVLPPTVHPDTGRPYEWIGKPLHETTPEQLPLIEV